MFALLLRLSRFIDALSDALGRATAWLSLPMVLLAAGNAVLRYSGRFVGQNLTTNAFLEGQWYLFSLIFLFGAAPALLRDRHVRVDLLYGRLGPRGQARVDLLGGLLFCMPFAWFVIWVSSPAVRASIAVWEGSPDPGGLPRWPIKCAILLSFGLLMAQGGSEVFKRAAQLSGRLPLPAPAGEGA